jgi:hypothetical protein
MEREDDPADRLMDAVMDAMDAGMDEETVFCNVQAAMAVWNMNLERKDD